MYEFKIGDIVIRKSYGGDIHFKVVGIIDRRDSKPVYVLKGLLYRIIADSYGDDLAVQNARNAYLCTRRCISDARRIAYEKGCSNKRFLSRLKGRPGRILHIDSSSEFLDKCLKFYRKENLRSDGILADESEQPQIIRRSLERNKPDILVVTGHDSMKKGSGDLYSINNYRNSKYYIESVKEARQHEPDFDRLCIFAGACQSYFEAIMKAGANFASSPGRIFINVLDPALAADKIALTDSKTIVAPKEIADITITGSEGIGGINTRGRLVRI